MKKLKTIFAVIILSFVLTAYSTAGTVIDPNPSTAGELKSQIKKEIIDAFSKEISLYYSDKNVKGEAYVTICVCKNGKISIKEVNGDNNSLNAMIEQRFQTKNLWTDTSYKDDSFTFKIVAR